MDKKKKGLKPEDEFDFFDIDLNRLEEEWQNQPKIFFKVSCQLTAAERKESKLKASREVIKADIAAKMRKAPSKYGLEKATEAAINSKMMTQDPYVKAQNLLLDKRYRVGILRSAIFALNHRKAALENEVKLHGQNYFSKPQATDSDSQSYIDESSKKRNRKGKKRKSKG